MDGIWIDALEDVKQSCRKRTVLALAREELAIEKMCAVCRNEPRERRLLHCHHVSYRAHTDVVWLCRGCHMAVHRDGPGQRVGLWRGLTAGQRARVFADARHEANMRFSFRVVRSPMGWLLVRAIASSRFRTVIPRELHPEWAFDMPSSEADVIDAHLDRIAAERPRGARC